MGAQETPHQEEISELENKIIQQVEYYFGNHNLRRDKFLKEQMKLDDGWVPLEVMVKFNRLRSLSEDTSVIAGALKKSTNHLLEVSEDDTKIRRCLDKPVPEFSPETRIEIDRRTIYAKRFPGATTLDELLQFFKGFGNIDSVFMKKKPNKAFKGSVFVTFGTQEEAQNFLKLGSVKFNNNDLMREYKEAYVKRKELEYQQRKSAKEKKQKKNEQEQKKEAPEDQPESSEREIVKGCVLKLSGLSETTTREDILELLQSDGKIAYLEYSRGKPEAFIRFFEGIAQSVLDKHSKEEDGIKKIPISGVDAVGMVLEGEIELEYWEKIRKGKSDIRQKGNFKKGKGRFNPRTAGKDRFRSGKRGRRNDMQEEEPEKSDETTEPPKKVMKMDREDDAPVETKTEKDNSD